MVQTSKTFPELTGGGGKKKEMFTIEYPNGREIPTTTLSTLQTAFAAGYTIRNAQGVVVDPKGVPV